MVRGGKRCGLRPGAFAGSVSLAVAPPQFYDILQRRVEYGSGEATSGELTTAGRAEAEVGASLWAFAWLVAPAVAVHPLAGLLRNWWCFSWRRTLIKSYLTRWNTQLPTIEGASQRVHEDSQRFASGIQSCVSVVLESVLTLIVFCPVLYDLDPVLMGVAVAAAAGGLSVSVLAGWPLVGLEVRQSQRPLTHSPWNSSSPAAREVGRSDFHAKLWMILLNFPLFSLAVNAMVHRCRTR